MEITISIGADSDDRCVTVNVSDDEPFSFDLIDHLMTRAAANAITVWRELHTEATT